MDVAAAIARALPSRRSPQLQAHHLAAIHRCMSGHGRGGALLIVPRAAPQQIAFGYSVNPWSRKSTQYMNSWVHPTSGPLAFAAAGEREMRRQRKRREIEDAIQQTEAEAALIGRLTAIDGIVVLNHDMCVVGFGGKIPVPDDFPARTVLLVDPRSGKKEKRRVKEVFSGMRHISAAMACLSGAPDTFALVQSQDGPLTVMINRRDRELLVVRPLERFPDRVDSVDLSWRPEL